MAGSTAGEEYCMVGVAGSEDARPCVVVSAGTVGGCCCKSMLLCSLMLLDVAEFLDSLVLVLLLVDVSTVSEPLLLVPMDGEGADFEDDPSTDSAASEICNGEGACLLPLSLVDPAGADIGVFGTEVVMLSLLNLWLLGG